MRGGAEPFTPRSIKYAAASHAQCFEEADDEVASGLDDGVTLPAAEADVATTCAAEPQQAIGSATMAYLEAYPEAVLSGSAATGVGLAVWAAADHEGEEMHLSSGGVKHVGDGDLEDTADGMDELEGVVEQEHADGSGTEARTPLRSGAAPYISERVERSTAGVAFEESGGTKRQASEDCDLKVSPIREFGLVLDEEEHKSLFEVVDGTKRQVTDGGGLPAGSEYKLEGRAEYKRKYGSDLDEAEHESLFEYAGGTKWQVADCRGLLMGLNARPGDFQALKQRMLGADVDDEEDEGSFVDSDGTAPQVLERPRLPSIASLGIPTRPRTS